MKSNTIKLVRKQRRQSRIRKSIVGTAKAPRFSIFRSNRSLFVQLINDEQGKTLVGISEKHLEAEKMSKKRMERAKSLGMLLAQKAHEMKIKQAIFDKGSYKYHGLVKAVAEGAREGGLHI